VVDRLEMEIHQATVHSGANCPEERKSQNRIPEQRPSKEVMGDRRGSIQGWHDLPTKATSTG
jgi:hypothetical protein